MACNCDNNKHTISVGGITHLDVTSNHDGSIYIEECRAVPGRLIAPVVHIESDVLAETVRLKFRAAITWN